MGDQDAYTFSGIAGVLEDLWSTKGQQPSSCQIKGYAVGWWAQRRQKLSGIEW